MEPEDIARIISEDTDEYIEWMDYGEWLMDDMDGIIDQIKKLKITQEWKTWLLEYTITYQQDRKQIGLNLLEVIARLQKTSEKFPNLKYETDFIIEMCRELGDKIRGRGIAD